MPFRLFSPSDLTGSLLVQDIGSYEATVHLPRLLDRVAQGKTLADTRHCHPVTRLGAGRRVWGRLLTRRQYMRHRQPTARFLLLHTFSHLLINQLVFECGYGTASLRERIHCADGDHPMAAILIYTADGDSEGSMGGLVRMGRPGRLEPTVRMALDKATWCSSDPVCMESGSQGSDGCNLTACHSCALVPETTCEEQNRLLDRGVVIGTLQSPKSGFFSLAN